MGAIQKAGLITAAAGAILLCYFYALAGLLLLTGVSILDLGLVIVAIRFGLGGMMAKVMAEHLQLTSIFARSFWLGKGARYSIPLQPEDAPRLFSMVSNLSQRLGIAEPSLVSLEMSVNAWVELKGYRAGAGTTVLGIGYQLMAGLSEAEFEAVMAHEMTHAKLVRRGLKKLLSTGLRRSGSLAEGLRYRVFQNKESNRNSQVARVLFLLADRMVRFAARLVAAYSRQDEFDADYGSAQLCGADAARSALLKVRSVSLAASRIQWRELVARLESGESFSQWLSAEFAASSLKNSAENEIFNQYSTHPSLADRLAALAESKTATLSIKPKPAMELFAEPDTVAEKLISQIERILVEQEQIDSKRLQRWNRKSRGPTHFRALAGAGVLILLLGIVFLFVSLFTGTISFAPVALSLVTIGAGFGLIRLGRYRDRIILPIPDYEELKKAAEKRIDIDQKIQRDLESELQAKADAQRNKRKKASALVSETYEALGRCEYLRAHVASRLCLKYAPKSVEGTLGLCVAAAALRQTQQAYWSLTRLDQLTSIASVSTAWGAAWACISLGEWARAEAFLDQVLKTGSEPTLLLLQALSQSHRGKSRSAVLTARKACTPGPRNLEHAKLLISLLLEAGYFREAREHLQRLEPQFDRDPELVFSMVRLQLLLRKLDLANQWAARLVQPNVPPSMLVRLGNAFEIARSSEQAEAFYRQALNSGHYPEAHLGLGRLESARGNKAEARRLFFAALDSVKTLGDNAVNGFSIFHLITTELAALNEPALDCRAWLGQMSPTAPALAGQTVLVFARSRAEAGQIFEEIWNALKPGSPPLLPGIVQWKEASAEHQPVGPVRPGVQRIFG